MLGRGLWNIDQNLATLAQHLFSTVLIGDSIVATAFGAVKCYHDQAPFDNAHLTTAGYSKIADQRGFFLGEFLLYKTYENFIYYMKAG